MTYCAENNPPRPPHPPRFKVVKKNPWRSWRLGGSKPRPGGSQNSPPRPLCPPRFKVVKTSRAATGFSLIEMLFAIGILGLGLIMVAATFPVAVKWTAQNAQSTIGQVLAQKALAYIKTQYGVGSLYAPPASPTWQLLTGTNWYGFHPSSSGPANSIYYWTACIRPDPAGAPTPTPPTSSGTLYDLYIFVFNKGDVNNTYPGTPPSKVPILFTGKLAGNPSTTPFPLGSIGVDLNTGQVFRKIVNAGGTITMSGWPGSIIPPPSEPVLYAPPALNQASSPLIYVYVTTVSL